MYCQGQYINTTASVLDSPWQYMRKITHIFFCGLPLDLRLCKPVATPLGTYPETGGNVVEWREEEQEFKGEERDEQNETVGSQ